MEEMRLQKYIAMCGAASRRGAEKLITDGRVTVNGELVTELGSCVTGEETVMLDGNVITPVNKKIYIMLNKPVGYVTTVKDQRPDRKTVMDLCRDIGDRIYPVGRLDYNTEGLLLLTNDGDFTYCVTHPAHETEKLYEAYVEGIVEHKTAERLERGVVIDGRKTAPAKAEIIAHKNNSTILELTIHEGRNRQVRKMCSAVGHPVISLKRKAVGSLTLGNLPLGKWRHLRPDEVKKVLKEGTAKGER